MQIRSWCLDLKKIATGPLLVRVALETQPPRQRRAVSLRAGLETMPCEACASGDSCCTCSGDPPPYAAIGRVQDPSGQLSAHAVRGLVRRGLAALAGDTRLRGLTTA